VNLTNFENLSKKIEIIIEEYDKIKRDKEKIEAQMLKKEMESRETKRQMEKILRERNVIKKRLGTIFEKIDSLDLL
jgi:seryl-tRNA synthetase